MIVPEDGKRGGSGWINTFTGRKFYPMDPDPAEIDINDIAHALSCLCRFTGHTDGFYSVAQHSVILSQLVPDCDSLWALLHDSSEAYLVDVPRPIKRLAFMAPYREAEAALMLAVAVRFGLDPEEPESVKVADNRLLYTEARDLFSDRHPDWHDRAEPYPMLQVIPVGPLKAESMFLERFDMLTRPDPSAR